MRVYKKWIFTLLFLCIDSLNAKNLEANFQYFNFQNTEGINYIETYLSFLSTELRYKQINSEEFQGSILINIIIKQGDTINHIDNYLFNTPILKDTLTSQYFIDKQIIALNNGSYELSLELKDINSHKKSISASTSLKVGFPNNEISFSDIMILNEYRASQNKGPLYKSGFDVIPLQKQGNYFIDESESELKFYVEWYQPDSDTVLNSGYLFNYFIENEQTHIPITGFNAVKRKTATHLKAHISGFDISQLPSGNYNLVIQLLNRKGKVIIQKRLFFQRRNTNIILKPQDYASLNSEGSFVDEFTIIDEMAENISSLYPIANLRERSYAANQLTALDLEQMKKFFYGFWVLRNPLEPELEWNKYYKGVIKANELFTANKVKGFATDRGRIFLKYGAADYIENSVHDSNMLPYQIWNFNKIEEQTNCIFIFVETALGTNDYELIHSNVRGEIYNPNWKSVVTKTKF